MSDEDCKNETWSTIHFILITNHESKFWKKTQTEVWSLQNSYAIGLSKHSVICVSITHAWLHHAQVLFLDERDFQALLHASVGVGWLLSLEGSAKDMV